MKLSTREYLQGLAVIAVWLVSGCAAGLLGAFYGPGAASLILGLYLGVSGAFIHLILWALDRTPHWSYAGLVFGFLTTGSFILLNLEEGVHNFGLTDMLFIFLTLSFLSYIIFPIATLVAKTPSLSTD